MAMVKRGQGELGRVRVLISGLGNSGKTQSIKSFIEDGKSLVVLVCPGETGIRSLPEDSEVVTSYFYEGSSETDVYDPVWSIEALKSFEDTYKEVEKNKPDKLFVDGIHWWYAHNFNMITGGEYLSGQDMNFNPNKGTNDPYRSARFFNQAHTSFGQRLAALNASKIPFIGVTCLEEWQAARTESDRAGGIDAVRYLWPDLPGAMATRIVSRFDARISARLEKKCVHRGCTYAQEDELHHVWQFYPRGDVMGVGIKGYIPSETIMKRPYIHQSWTALQSVIWRGR